MKTPKAIGLAAALAALVLVPAAAVSQGKKAADVPAAARKSGMAEAPAIVTAAGLPCQVSDARKIGEDKKSKTSYYEVACGTGQMGYVLQAPAEGAATVFTCVEANTPPAPGQQPSAPCMLPGNADPKAALAPIFQANNVQCLPEQARGIGQTKTNTYLEVACQGGDGYIIMASAPFDAAKPAQAQSCLLYDDAETNIKCALTEKAARLAVVDRYAAAANNGCAVKDRRFVGAAKDNAQYFEASCQDGKGYIYKVSGGQLAETFDCAKASHLLGGCTLTDARQAQTEQAALYTKLAQAAGSKCEVERYALFPPKPGEENVELVCKDGSGAIGLFKASGGGSQVIDCGRAPVAGYKCSLSKDQGYANLTADLKKFNFNSCDVSESRVVGRSEKGTMFVEVACADGLKGYVIEYQAAPKVNAVGALGCAFAGNCKLKGNT